MFQVRLEQPTCYRMRRTYATSLRTVLQAATNEAKRLSWFSVSDVIHHGYDALAKLKHDSKFL